MAKKADPKKRASPKQTLSSQLCDLIESRDLTHYALGKLAGVSPAVITRFVNGERDMRMETASRIGTALGIRLVEVGAVKPRKKPKRA